MDYVLVALLISGPGTYRAEVIEDFTSMAHCKQALEAKAWSTENLMSLVCAKKDRN